MPRPLPYLLALLLGVGAALLVACGGGTRAGIPAASAGDLKSQIEDVQQAVEDGRCKDVSGQLRQVDDGIDDLPGSVDERLLQALRDASDKLRRTAVTECSEAATATTETTTTETPTTETTETQTQTAPTATATAPPQTTETTPPTVVPPPPPPVVPPATTPAPPPAEPPVPPPAGTPGGGATPEVGPE